MFGYVIIDGQAVTGARVTIISPHGRAEVWTDFGPKGWDSIARSGAAVTGDFGFGGPNHIESKSVQLSR